jgi:branched-chain amino acid transport system permease protein
MEVLINGAFIGALYGLYGLGLALSLGLMRQINLAHGDFIVFSAFLTLQLSSALHLHPLAVLPIVVAIMFVVGLVLQRLVIQRTLGRGEMPPVLVTFGLSIILQNVMLELFSADTRNLDPGPLGAASIDLGGLSLGVLPILTLVVAVAIFGATHAIFGSTTFGRAIRATSDNEQVAQLMGIRTRNVFALAMGLTLAISAVAATFYGMRGNFDPSTGPERMLFAFEAMILGGVGSIWGTLAGGILLGISQSAGTLLTPSFGPLVGHLVFLVGLLAVPGGLMSLKGRR